MIVVACSIYLFPSCKSFDYLERAPAQYAHFFALKGKDDLIATPTHINHLLLLNHFSYQGETCWGEVVVCERAVLDKNEILVFCKTDVLDKACVLSPEFKFDPYSVFLLLSYQLFQF